MKYTNERSEWSEPKASTETRTRNLLEAYVNGPLMSFELTDQEIVELCDSPEYASYSAEFQMWLDMQLDRLCTKQGQ